MIALVCTHVVGAFRPAFASPRPSLIPQRIARFLVALLVPLAACLPPDEVLGTLHEFTSDASGFDTHSFYYDTGTEVVVFDAQFTLEQADKLVAEIRDRTQTPITHLVITHPNPDKFNGATVFSRLGAQVVASESTARALSAVHAYKKYYFTQVTKQFTDKTYPPEPKIDVTFKGTYRIPTQSTARIDLIELNHPGVTSTQTIAYLPGKQAVIVGDLIHHKTHAWLEGGLQKGRTTPRADLEGWRGALTELSAFPTATLYGGRGPSVLTPQGVADQRAYLDGMEALVRAYLAELGPKTTELANPQLAPKHYDELTKRATMKYPDHALPYLVRYSIYGLINQWTGM